MSVAGARRPARQASVPAPPELPGSRSAPTACAAAESAASTTKLIMPSALILAARILPVQCPRQCVPRNIVDLRILRASSLRPLLRRGLPAGSRVSSPQPRQFPEPRAHAETVAPPRQVLRRIAPTAALIMAASPRRTPASSVRRGFTRRTTSKAAAPKPMAKPVYMATGHHRPQHKRIQRPQQMCPYSPARIRAQQSVKCQHQCQVDQSVPHLKPEDSAGNRVPCQPRRDLLGHGSDRSVRRREIQPAKPRYRPHRVARQLQLRQQIRIRIMSECRYSPVSPHKTQHVRRARSAESASRRSPQQQGPEYQAPRRRLSSHGEPQPVQRLKPVLPSGQPSQATIAVRIR